MNVDTKTQRCDEPAQDSDGAAWGDPMPATGFNVRSPVINDSERQCQESGCHEPGDEPGRGGRGNRHQTIVDEPLGQGSHNIPAQQRGKTGSYDQCKQDGKSDGVDAGSDE